MSDPNDGLFEFASSLVRAQATTLQAASRTDDTTEAAAAIERAADRLVGAVEPSMLRMMLLAGEFTYKMQERGKSWLQIEEMLRENFQKGSR